MKDMRMTFDDVLTNVLDLLQRHSSNFCPSSNLLKTHL